MTRRNREGIVVETEDFIAFVRRILRALGRRVGGDIETLGALRDLEDELHDATQAAVDGCRADGFSWAEIAQRLGCTKQSAWERYGRPVRSEPVECQDDPDEHAAAPMRAAS